MAFLFVVVAVAVAVAVVVVAVAVVVAVVVVAVAVAVVAVAVVAVVVVVVAVASQSADVPCWMFIGWISQMVALLDKPEGVAIHSILLSIATDYPQALCYPLKISSRDYKFDSSPLSQEQRNFVEKSVQWWRPVWVGGYACLAGS